MKSKSRSKRSSKPRLKYGSGYVGLAMAICGGNKQKRKRLFGF